MRGLLGLLAVTVAVAALAAREPRRGTRKAMEGAAGAFLESLDATQRRQAVLPFDAEERYDWHYVPRGRAGVRLGDLTPSQYEQALALMRSGLSQRGYVKATTIIKLEEVLRELEGGRGPERNRENYHLLVFGEPAKGAAWGWRVEGHHLSLHFTVVDGQAVAAAPRFLGANPARVPHGPMEGTRALAREEDLARGLLRLLSPEQRDAAVLSKQAPADIVTRNVRKVDPLKPEGLAAGRMSAAQKAKLRELLDEYLRNLPDDLAEERLERIRREGLDGITFAWAGGELPGQPHYYRLQGASFLVEYDNTQDGANHIHTVWRDFEGDFGEDLLKRHYESSPHHRH